MSNKTKQWVLVIEDDEDLLEVLGANLELHGYTVLGVSSGQVALEKLSNQRFDCILIDLNLGAQNYNGQKIAKKIRQSPSCAINQKTPIIVCSGNINMDSVNELKGHISDAVTKPIDIYALIEKIKRCTLEAS